MVNTVTFLFDATCEHDKSIPKNEKKSNGNTAGFSFREASAT